MLLLFNQFILKKAIKSPLYILSPSITPVEEVELPRLSVIHYLDTKSEIHFPARDINYLSSIQPNKKIPIYNVLDLTSKEEIASLQNKKLPQEVRKWSLDNIKQFRSINLLETPNTDVNVVSIYNYNLLKDLYKYKTSLLANYFKYYNLYSTYWNYIKESITKDQESYHFVKIDLPIVIPNYNIINIIIKFNQIKFARIVSDINLIKIIDLYKWLLNETRQLSTMKDISDKDSTRIVVELSYKGYSTFLPLNIIRSLCKESDLPFDSKVTDTKVQKLFILSLYKLQNKINSLIEETTLDTDVTTKEPSDASIDVIKHEDDEEIDDFDISNDLDDEIAFPGNNDIPEQLSSVTVSKLNESNINKVNKNIDNKINKGLVFNEVNLSSILDEELNTLDVSETDKIFEESILKLNESEDSEIPITVNTNPDHIHNVLKTKTLNDKFDLYMKEVSEFKLLTAQEIRTLKKTIESRQQLKSPYDESKQIDAYKQLSANDITLTKNDIELDIKNDIVDDGLKSDIILNFDKKYVNNVLNKDIVACVTNLEKAGIIVKEYTIEHNNSVTGRYDLHRITLKPLHGKESTVYFRIPKIDSEGEMVVAGIRGRMRKQRTELPIRKISPIKVALTSNYNKLFISRTERKAYDEYAYIVSYIKNSYLDQNGNVVKIKPGHSYSNLKQLPNMYSNMSMNFNLVETNKYTFCFNYNDTEKFINSNVNKDINSKKLTFVGYDKDKNILVMDSDDIIYNYTKNMEELGDFVDLLEIDRTKLPKSFSAINILGDAIPLGVALSYYMGISNLISVTGVKHKILESNKQYKPNKNELVLRYNDYKLIIESDNKNIMLLFNGFTYFKDIIKEYSLKDFDLKEVYLVVLEYRNLSLLHIKELNLLEELFLDPITIDVLKSINEPTDYLRLLLRANELLSDFSHPDINDPKYCRIRGYDRIPGLMYKALAESVRTYKFKGSNRSKIELDPYKVWNYVTQDNTVKITEDNNPITDTKEFEAVTFTGSDGLNKDATPKLLRRFHKNDIGFISEATVDSGDVALNIYLSPYAKLKDLRGLYDENNTDHKENEAKIFSTSALLAPGSDQDDSKRIGFVSIQNGHTITTEGYRQPIMRTSYEYVMPYKVGNLYCVMAKDDGVVIERTDKVVICKYKDGTTEGYQIGKRFGRMEGSVYPHEVISNLKTNDKFKKGDNISYNSGFFEPDWLDPNKLIMKFGKDVTVALAMTNEVFEDSSAISPEFSKVMTTTIVKEKSFIIESNKNITNLIPEGSEVNPNSVLFTVMDENTDYNNLSESTIDMLQNLAALSPKAKVNGVIEKYEIRYNGDVSDMSPTFKKLVNRLDKQLYEETKGTEIEATTGQVTSEYRVEGKNLNIDNLELKVYISVKLSQSIGDKSVFCNQMKSVNSEVFTETIYTESGTKVDALFSYRGILARIVNSPILIGTTTRLVKHVSKQAADIYFK